MTKVLVVDDDENILTTLQIHLEDLGLAVSLARCGREGIEIFRRLQPEIVLLDLKLPDMDGMDVLQELSTAGAKSFVAVITAYATIDTAVQAIKLGAFDYLPKPFTPAQVSHLIEMINRVRGLESEVQTLKEKLKGVLQEGDFITASRNVRSILRTVRQVADSDANILLSGESGTGKGVLARLIHSWSPRKDGPFITVDCAALQENLLESDLFGHVKGAFTGAIRDKVGKLELANGGTVFLDEVSEMSPAVQAKFLHFLQYREFERLGDVRTIHVDLRVIAATNRELEERVQEKLFRKDLFYRLNVVEIFMPPLRERPEDIPLLAEHYLSLFAKQNNKNVSRITEQARDSLRAYPWPGNIRELINVIHRGTILSRDKCLSIEDLPQHIAHYRASAQHGEELASLADIERLHIRKVLLHTTSLEEAAQVLGIDPTTLWRKRKKYQLD
ncbi:sigma-54-dependent transcriptional regulator [Desulfoferrobacter suflitae]|uniref:sigma-54-dependent transcriptional regulator n=1 Tax=Desulfoferrobacter suflitae TaxID=2865782 RepID=UPI00216402EB|nr:sigma-54 dependent transcriptional regulator [Desulfoferrobacter suflitae]MCK8601784.1 sigma-54 dependent transcriptional regulator [Desulfoferrobacter suflitae]